MTLKKTTTKTPSEAHTATKTSKAGDNLPQTEKTALSGNPSGDKSVDQITDLLNQLYAIATERVEPSIHDLDLTPGETPHFKYPARERLKAIELHFKATGLLPR